MTKLRRQRHKPERAYYVRKWPLSLDVLPNQTSSVTTRYSLLSWCHWAGLSTASKIRSSGISYEAVRQLALRQEKKGRCNAYHNRNHIAQVIIASGLLAHQAKLSQIETDHLIIAALIHDYGHLGHFRNKAPFWQEQKSWQQSMAILRRFGCAGHLSSAFYNWLMATSPFADHQRIKGQNTITALLVDADLFGSLFLAKPIVRQLSQAVRFEDKILTDLDEFIQQFIAQCEAKGLASQAAQSLHKRLPDGYSYFKS